MKVSMLAKSAAVALAFGLVTSTPAHAVDLSGSGASFPALLIEACKAPFATASGHSFTYAASGSGTGRTNSDRAVEISGSQMQHTQQRQSVRALFTHQ
jgi:phosphate transport system substrate-binding protein